MEAVIALALMGFLINKFTDFLKFLTNKQWNAAITQLEVWLAGVVVVFIGANASVTSGVGVGNLTLGSLGWVSLLLLGLTVGSSASILYDAKKAGDNTDSAATPPLVPGSE